MAVKPANARSAKPSLDQEVFVEAGLRLAARPHTLSLTYRELGDELGVDPTAIYRHFSSKESLMQDLLDRLFRMAYARMTVPVSDWENCLDEFTRATLEVFLEYPAIAVTATSLTTSGPGELDSIELMLSCFHQAGLRGQDLAEQYAIFGSYVLSGAAGLARDHAESAEPETHEWFSGNLRADPARHPHAAAIRADILALDHREMFLAGAKQIVQAARDKSKNQESSE